MYFAKRSLPFAQTFENNPLKPLEKYKKMIKIIMICFLFFKTWPTEGTANLGLSKKKAVGLEYHNNNFARDHVFLYITFPLRHHY